MHKYCNSDYYLSPSQRCLSLLWLTASSLLISDIELKCKALLLPARYSEWSFALFKGSSEVQYSRPDILPQGAVGYSVGFSYTFIQEVELWGQKTNQIISWNQVLKMQQITSNDKFEMLRKSVCVYHYTVALFRAFIGAIIAFRGGNGLKRQQQAFI